MKITNDHIRIIKTIAIFYSSGYDSGKRNDIFSAALLGATKAAKRFNEKRGSFTPFMKSCVVNEINSELRKIKRRGVEDSLLNIEEMVTQSPWQDVDTLNPEELLLKVEEYQEAFWVAWEIGDKLWDNDRMEFHVLHRNILHPEPESIRSIAKRFNCSKSTVHRAVLKIKEMIREER